MGACEGPLSCSLLVHLLMEMGTLRCSAPEEDVTRNFLCLNHHATPLCIYHYFQLMKEARLEAHLLSLLTSLFTSVLGGSQDVALFQV